MDQKSRSLVQKIYADRQRLPRLARGAHVLLTGIPDAPAKMRDSSPARELLRDLVWLALFMITAASGAMLFNLGVWAGWAGLPVTAFGALGAIGRLRRLVVGHVHEATHGVVTSYYRRRGLSKRRAHTITERILDLGSALTFSLNGQDYRREHNRHHRPEMLGTLKDPDGRQLYEWGLWPTLSPNLYRALFTRLINPVWHARFFGARIRTNMFRGKAYRRALGAAMLLALSGSAFVLPLPVWIAAVFVPFGPGYQIASLLQVITEHPYGFAHASDSMDDLAARTWERIPYAPMPEASLRAAPLNWLVWMGRNAVHLAERLAVLDDTMIAHGYHHLAWPLGRPFNDWWNTSARMIKAYHAGVLPPGADSRFVQGLSEALALQRRQFEQIKRDHT